VSRDYKPSAPRANNKSSKGSPFFTGLLVGLLLGVGISVAVVLLVKGSNSPFVAKVTPGATPDLSLEKPDASALPKETNNGASNSNSGNSNAANDNPDKPRFDFYTILPGSETKVTEEQIKQKEAQDAAGQIQETYFLQVGAFATEQEADNLKAKLALLGMEAIVQTVTIPDKGVLHRVRVGPLADLDKIEKSRTELSKNGFNTDLIKVQTNTPNQ